MRKSSLTFYQHAELSGPWIMTLYASVSLLDCSSAVVFYFVMSFKTLHSTTCMSVNSFFADRKVFCRLSVGCPAFFHRCEVWVPRFPFPRFHRPCTESRFLAVSLQVTSVINPAVGCHYFPPGLQLPPRPLRGLLPVLLLGEERHDGCEQFA